MNDDDIAKELRAAARRADGDLAPGVLAAPLGDSFRAKALARIRSERGTTAEGAPPLSTPRRAAPPTWRRRVFSAVPAIALAAAVAAIYLRPASLPGESARLPAYGVLVEGGERETRGASEADPEGGRSFAPDSPVTLRLRPPTAVVGALDVRVVRIAAVTEEVRVPLRVSEAGAIEIAGRAREVFGASPGRVELVVVVARAGLKLDPLALAAPGVVLPPQVQVSRIAAQIVVH